jgi:hypothetical protein
MHLIDEIFGTEIFLENYFAAAIFQHATNFCGVFGIHTRAADKKAMLYSSAQRGLAPTGGPSGMLA